MAAALEGNGYLYSIDISSDCDEALRRALKVLGLDQKVRIIVGDSAKVQISKEVVGLVFVDGDHSYEGVKRDITAWYPRLRPGGFLCFHDAIHSRINDTGYFEVNQAVTEAVSSPDFALSTYCSVGSFAAFQKASDV